LVEWYTTFVDPSYTLPLPILSDGPISPNEALATEIESLQAICEEDVSVKEGKALLQLLFILGNDVFGPGEALLELRIATANYPVSPHLIALIRNSNVSSELLVKASLQLAARALELVGEPLCFALYDYAKTLDIRELGMTDLASLRAAIITPNLPTRPPKFTNPSPSSSSKAARSKGNNSTARNTLSLPMRKISDMESQSNQLSKRFQHLKSDVPFVRNLERRAKLPAHQYKKKILTALDENRVVLIDAVKQLRYLSLSWNMQLSRARAVLLILSFVSLDDWRRPAWLLELRRKWASPRWAIWLVIVCNSTHALGLPLA